VWGEESRVLRGGPLDVNRTLIGHFKMSGYKLRLLLTEELARRVIAPGASPKLGEFRSSRRSNPYMKTNVTLEHTRQPTYIKRD